MSFDDDLHAVAGPRVMLVEDDQVAGAAVIESLERAGIQTAWAMTGASALGLQRSFSPAVVLLDITLPDIDGLKLVRFLSQAGDCGIIIVSGLTDEADRIVGLEVGADDYVAKPPHQRELLARIRAVYRRVRSRSDAEARPARSVFRIGKIKVDLAGRRVETVDGERIPLTTAEFVVLATLWAADGDPVSRSKLSEVALHHRWSSRDRGVDQLILGLRQKLARVDGRPMIHSIRGTGYVLSVIEDPPADTLG